MTRPTLESCREKLAWASKHLDNLVAEHDAWNEESVALMFEQVTGIERATDGGPDWNVLYAGRITRPLPVRWGLIVGDAVHNMRSSLDHLVCRLIELEGGRPTTSTAFPIWDKDPAKIVQKKKRQERLALFNQRLAGMSAEHKEGIRALQPYQRLGTPEADRLIVLAGLDNLDKHQVILPAAALFGGLDTTKALVSTSAPSVGEIVWNAGALIVPGTWIARGRGNPPAQVHVKAELSINAVFGESRTSVSELREIHAYCVGIVESFGPVFK